MLKHVVCLTNKLWIFSTSYRLCIREFRHMVKFDPDAPLPPTSPQVMAQLAVNSRRAWDGDLSGRGKPPPKPKITKKKKATASIALETMPLPVPSFSTAHTAVVHGQQRVGRDVSIEFDGGWFEAEVKLYDPVKKCYNVKYKLTCHMEYDVNMDETDLDNLVEWKFVGSEG